MEELIRRNFVPRMTIVPMKLLLNTKVNPDGSFQKTKCRQVLQGIKGKYMHEGIHFSIVFAAAPSTYVQRMMQALAVGLSFHRFAADINQAYLHSESPRSWNNRNQA